MILIDNEQIQAFLQNETKKEKNIWKTGFLKCEVVPPQNLLFPILPTCADKKLLFVLCDKCATLKDRTKKCEHFECERSIKGTWCLHEIYKALEQGYNILETDELLYYENKKRIFENYVTKFHVLKTQYSEQLKKRLSQQILDDFEVFIDPKDIPDDHNMAMRYIMKLILNSLWGKLCQNFNKSFIKFVSSAEELYDLIYDHSYDSVYFDILDSEMACVSCNYTNETNYKVNKTCTALGCYVTCYAHLKLLKCLNQLPANSVLYYDTDSVIYYSENGHELIQTDSKLGCLESELSKNEYIM